MENYTVSNEKGNIIITEKAIKKVILKAIYQSEEKIVFADNKWKPAKRGAKALDVSETNYVEITCASDGICVELYLLIKEPYKATEVTEEMIEKIDEALISLLGKPSSSIALNIQKKPSKALLKN